jgi:anti-anti-sigma factor
MSLTDQPSPPLLIDARPLPSGAMLVAAFGELDIATAPSLGEALARERQERRHVLLDLGGVSFIDSTGLSALLCAQRDYAATGLELRLGASLSPQVRRLLELTGVLAQVELVDAI